MCYDIASSLRTTAISLFAIIYLLRSKIPHFQWIAITLIGWCGMQFAELLLWLTNPKESCTTINQIITLSLIPLVLISQPLAPLIGSLIVFPWNKSSQMRKYFIIAYSVFICLAVAMNTYWKPYKLCTTVTPTGHLFWSTTEYINHNKDNNIIYTIWAGLILLPLFLFWNKSAVPIILLSVLPLIGFIYGKNHSDSKASLWCFYTSYASIIAVIMLVLQQNGVYKFL